MKNITRLVSVLLLWSMAAQGGLPPATLKGQSDASATTTFNLQVPGSQATRLGGTTALLETGNDNVLSDPGVENPSGTGGWTAYADAAGTSPVDGTGGSPTITCTRTTSSPLDGAGSLLITKDAANRQGEGCAKSFTIPRKWLAKVVDVSFSYEVASGTYDAGSDTTDSDLTAWVYGPTDGTPVITQLAGYKILGVSSGTIGRFSGRVQTAATGSVYRLILHEAKTGTSAYTLKLDSSQVAAARGANATFIKPTIQKFTSSSGTYTTPTGVAYIRVRMVGGGGGGAGSGTGSTAGNASTASTASTFGPLLTAGAATGGGAGSSGSGGSVTLSSPAVGTALAGAAGSSGSYANLANSGYAGAPGASTPFGGGGGAGNGAPAAGGAAVANTGAGGGGGGVTGTVGSAGGGGGAGGFIDAFIPSPSATYTYTVGIGGSGGNGGTSGAAGGAGGSGYIEVTEYYYPGVPQDQSSEGRVVALQFQLNNVPSGTPANGSVIKFAGTPTVDTHTAWSSANGTFTCPVPGLYWMAAGSEIASSSPSAGQFTRLSFLLNGGAFYNTPPVMYATNVVPTPSGTAQVKCNAGDTLSVSLGTNLGGTLTYGNNYAFSSLFIGLLSGNSQVFPSESVNARYSTAANQAVTTGGGSNIINFDTKSFDSHLSVTTGASWKFTAPISGKYQVNSKIIFANAAWVTGDYSELDLYKNGSNASVLHYHQITGTSTQNVMLGGSDIISLAQGDYVQISLNFSRTGGNVNLNSTATYNYFSVSRVGN